MNYELTPVERRGQYYFKREDRFAPFRFCGVNGSKLRQCMMLVEKNREQAEKGLITATSILSPQAPITAAVAREMGVPCTIVYGGTTGKRLASLAYPQLCSRLGADVRIASASGRTSVITARAQALAQDSGAYLIRYGFDMRGNIDCFLRSVAEQVRNIPDRLDNLVVTVGSAITIVGILYGIAVYGKRVRNVYGVGCAPNREAKIRELAGLIRDGGFGKEITPPLRYIDAFNKYKGFKYEDICRLSYNGLVFHPRYEAKAFRWLCCSKLQGETLFWVTGADIIDKYEH